MPDFEVKHPEQPGPTGRTTPAPIFWKDPALDDGFTPDAIGVEIRADNPATPLLVNGVDILKEIKRSRQYIGCLAVTCTVLVLWVLAHIFNT